MKWRSLTGYIPISARSGMILQIMFKAVNLSEKDFKIEVIVGSSAMDQLNVSKIPGKTNQNK